MILDHTFVAHDRRHAGMQLADKLSEFKNSNAIVVAVSQSGAVIGYYIAQQLGLPFEVCLCKAIEHPANRRQTLGSISADAVLMHSDSYGIPRDYIHHQIILNQSILKSQRQFYRVDRMLDVRERKVILVGETFLTMDSLAASLHEIRRQRPEKVVVAAAACTPEVASELARCTNDVTFLVVEHNIKTEKLYHQYSTIDDKAVKYLLRMAAVKINYN
ncbi:phosphoribosyltransferase family protein [Pseudochryseolinea flava]|uniref:Phosphoribosyltransferase domain-containing protein n=1 Tax=Pseudochryseolinea flava TaxID=2059302 RepID=A0A364Y646_9BACT|nr:phosphoribosyltransferase family protein [Pseudochryseolinea flava]RAW02564.1 hypothetical protein DQQ10_00140 [Pseudochryseolinea flava]